jgi:hypothetical protein
LSKIKNTSFCSKRKDFFTTKDTKGKTKVEVKVEEIHFTRREQGAGSQIIRIVNNKTN